MGKKFLLTDNQSSWAKIGFEIASRLFPSAEVHCLDLDTAINTQDQFDIILYKNTKITTKQALKNETRWVSYDEGYKQWQKNIDNLLLNQVRATIIDKCEFGRMDENIPLIIPEINGHLIRNKRVVASPNCTTIQVVLPLHYMRRVGALKQVYVASYQSWSGSNPLNPQPKHNNLLPWIENEEEKLIAETQKILQQKIEVIPHCVRVPTVYCHGAAITVVFENDVNIADIVFGPGVKVQDRDNTTAINQPDIYVSRLRQVNKNTISFWSITDNNYKGSILNQLQIAERKINDF